MDNSLDHKIKFIHSKNFKKGKTTYLLMHGYGCDEYDLVDGFDSLIRDLDGQWVSVRAYYPLQNQKFCWTYLPATLPNPPKEISNDFEFTQEMLEISAQAQRAVEELVKFINNEINAKVIPIGFSQGSMMATQLIRKNCELVEKAVMLSGYIDFLPHQNDKNISNFKVQTFVGYGDCDSVLPQSYLQLQAKFLRENTISTQKIYSTMDHTITFEELVDIKKFLQNK